MIIIGITGSIGMGKTTIASMLRSLKIPVFDSDQQVKEILDKNISVIEKIYNEWPETVCFKKMKINKLLLAKKIFTDKKNRKKLENIIHPIVHHKRKIFIEQNNLSLIIGLDIPLLYETGTDKLCDYIFLANTSERVQKKRVMLRPHMTENMFALIKTSQWSNEKKKEKKPIIINTSYGKLVSFLIVSFYLIKIIINGKKKND